MTPLETSLAIGLAVTVLIAAVAITMLLAVNRNQSRESERLRSDVEKADGQVRDLQEQVTQHREATVAQQVRVDAFQERVERLTSQLEECARENSRLISAMERFAAIDDAEQYAARVRADAESNVADLTVKAKIIREEALQTKEQALKLKSQRDALSQQVKSLAQFRDGCDKLDKLEHRRSELQTEIVRIQGLVKNEQDRLHEAQATSKSQYDAHLAQLERQIQIHRTKFEEDAKAQLAALDSELHNRRTELGLLDEIAELQSYGLYPPRFNFEHSERYRQEMRACVEEQKRMVRDKEACVCTTVWKVEGSEAKGRTMINRYIKLMLRAINGECDAIVAKVTHSNVVASEKRITKCFEIINGLGESNYVTFSPAYEQLKLRELYLTYEHAAKKQEEREREREIREAMREEEKAQREIEQAKQKAERDEEMKATALAKARAELAEQHGQHNAKLAQLVAKLESELSEAIDRKAKAIARAQLTRSGHVYILSNIGTMGEQIYKIGMTRRLEPLERIKELGDASVPFPFDFHALIYSEDAPSLENALHNRFHDRRVNLVNLRKEYFAVTLEEIQAAVAELHGLVTFRLHPEAEQYRETLAIRQKANSYIA